MTHSVELVLDINATLGEGPHWDPRVEKLYWVDIKEKRLNAFDPKSGANDTYQFDQYIGAAIPGNDGRFLLAMENGIYEYSSRQGRLNLIVDPEEDLPDNRFNDAKCDPSGRLWAGTMSMTGELKQGSLYRLDHDRKLTKVLSDVSISNGLAWSPDHKYMHYIDTPTGKVVTFDYDNETGEISNQRTAVEVPREMGAPDGMTIDEEGMIWVAHWGGARVTRWNPATGELLLDIPIPAKNVTSCAFGGKNLNELYITTANDGLSEEDLEKYPKTGGIFRVKTNVTGVVNMRYE